MEQILANFRTTFIFLLISAIFFVLDRLGTVSLLRNFAQIPFEFAQLPVIVAKTNLIEKIEFIANLAKIEKENSQLANKLAEALAENIRLQNLEAENAALRSQIGFSANKIESIPAKVMGYSRFLIVVPEKTDKIKVGATVTLGNNFVGQVVETGVKLVKVKIPQDPASTILAAVTTPAGLIRGVLSGRYGMVQVLEKVEKQEVVLPGSIVQTTGEAGILPGLILGRISRVEKADPSPFLEIEVESLVDFSKLTTVFVISQ